MSHYSVAVAVVTHDDPSRAGIDNEVAMVLEPYNENGEWSREGSHWDWKRMFDALPGYAQLVIVDCHV